MENKIDQILSKSIILILRPLCRILLRNAIAFGTFADWAKKAYVDVAFEDFAIEGKKQTYSRVAGLTGIFRREVKRLREQSDEDQNEKGREYNRAIRVISGWLTNKAFQNTLAQPATLPIEGDTGSFAALVKEYSGDIPTKAMLNILVNAKTVETKGNEVRLLQHAFIPSDDPLDKLHILGTDVAELVSTIDHNLVSPSDNLHFQRKVSNCALDEKHLAEFQSLAAKKSQQLLEELNEWLISHEVSPQSDKVNQGKYVSLGIYYSDQPCMKE